MRHLIARGVRLEVCTGFPELFPFDVRFAPWSKSAQITVHYVVGKSNPSTTQWRDICATARTPNAEYAGHWPARPSPLVARVRELAGGRPIVLVNGGRWPMDRADGFGAELLPAPDVFNGAIERLRKTCFVVFIGRGSRLFDVSCDLDLNDRTTPDQVMDLALAAHGGFAQCGFMLPLMEMFDKPLLCMFTERARASARVWIRQMTPKKLLGKETSHYVVDGWDEWRRAGAVDAFRDEVLRRELLSRKIGGTDRQRADDFTEPAGSC
ncbi:MAG TPA: hypothetical protein VGA88_00925 [Burkholderiales bacterium]